MIQPDAAPRTPDWWFRRLDARRRAQMPANSSRRPDNYRARPREDFYDLLWAWYCNEAPFLNLSSRYARITREFLRLTGHAYASIIVHAMVDRTQVIGGRTADPTDDDAFTGDEIVSEFLAENGATITDGFIFRNAMGEGGWLVGPPAPGERTATVTAIDPRYAVWEMDPNHPRRVRAFARWMTVDDEKLCILYLDDGVRVARQGPDGWVWESFAPIPVPELGIPFIPLHALHGVGLIEPHLGTLERIQNGLADRLWAAKHGLFALKLFSGSWVKEDENGNPILDSDGNPIDWDLILMGAADPASVLRLPEDVKLQESRELNLAPYRDVIKDDQRMLAAEARVPLPMLAPDTANQSAESSQQAEKGLIFSADEFRTRHTPDVSRLLRFGVAYSSETEGGPLRGTSPRMSPIWAPTQLYTLGEQGNVAAQLGVKMPTEIVATKYLNFTPEEMRDLRIAQDRQVFDDAITASIAGEALNDGTQPNGRSVRQDRGVVPGSGPDRDEQNL